MIMIVHRGFLSMKPNQKKKHSLKLRFSQRARKIKAALWRTKPFQRTRVLLQPIQTNLPLKVSKERLCTALCNICLQIGIELPRCKTRELMRTVKMSLSQSDQRSMTIVVINIYAVVYCHYKKKTRSWRRRSKTWRAIGCVTISFDTFDRARFFFERVAIERGDKKEIVESKW